MDPWSVGCRVTAEKLPTSSKLAGASCLQVSQLMHVASTKKLPVTLESSRFFSSAIVKPLRVHACQDQEKLSLCSALYSDLKSGAGATTVLRMLKKAVQQGRSERRCEAYASVR